MFMILVFRGFSMQISGSVVEFLKSYIYATTEEHTQACHSSNAELLKFRGFFSLAWKSANGWSAKHQDLVLIVNRDT